MDDLSHLSISEMTGSLGLIFEMSFSFRDLDTLSKWVTYAEAVDISNWDAEDITRLFYNISNGWTYKKRLRISSDIIEFNNEENGKTVYYIRKALEYCIYQGCEFQRSQLLVNLGNELSHLGRVSEAIGCWEAALSDTPNFGMAVGNLGFWGVYHGKMLPDTRDKVMFCRYAYPKLITASKSKDVYEEAQADFKLHAELIRDYIGDKNLNLEIDLDNYPLGDSEAEIDYREWCLFYRLHLNYLNDIHIESIAGSDNLVLPTMTMRINQPLVCFDIFNQIKQEFTSARYFIYRGITEEAPHFADKNNILANTMGMNEYSHNIEMLKSGFRMCYSVLDKIALFINYYLGLGVDAGRVSFGKIWYEKDGKQIKKKIAESQNWLLRGLYWLSRDFYSKEESIVDPEAQDIAKIRNYIEHRSFKVGFVDSMIEYNDGVTLEIDRYYFEDKCLKTLRLVRAAIIYLCLAVSVEELKEENNNQDVISFDLQQINDNDKK